MRKLYFSSIFVATGISLSVFANAQQNPYYLKTPPSEKNFFQMVEEQEKSSNENSKTFMKSKV
ncbi:MAG TPA: hypothetical protein PLW09_07320, partial [Candidatus Kapabacteria bacterium]|nr:hypothetical protein [Candidatus Kapabacteria bacterium]